jgi:hypothetical protein
MPKILEGVISLTDIFDRIFNDLSSKLKTEEDRILLKLLLDTHRKNGKKGMEQLIDERIEQLEG